MALPFGLNIFVILRVILGSLFVISGGEKLIGPYQNFLYVVQGYELLNPLGEEITARVIPWIELILGLFLFLGFWLPIVLRGVVLLSLTFLTVVGQAIIRDLPVSECGCFGGLISFPLKGVLMLDITILILTIILLWRIDDSAQVGLDRCF